METLFVYLVLLAQILAIFTVAALIADKLVQPWIDRRHKH